ncbi:hypothetical protein F2P79_004754 [Pimephales promelas]|nr:hypothetical protein F2P79_004754 [Pimephales promelas]
MDCRTPATICCTSWEFNLPRTLEEREKSIYGGRESSTQELELRQDTVGMLLCDCVMKRVYDQSNGETRRHRRVISSTIGAVQGLKWMMKRLSRGSGSAASHTEASLVGMPRETQPPDGKPGRGLTLSGRVLNRCGRLPARKCRFQGVLGSLAFPLSYRRRQAGVTGKQHASLPV